MLTLPLALDVRAPSRARRAVQEFLRPCTDASVVHAAVLVTSELVTHAVLDREAESRELLELRLTTGGTVLRIELTDSSRRHRLASLSVGVPGGQGMRIVAASSARWGFLANGATMWSEITCHRAGEPPVPVGMPVAPGA